MIRNRHNLVLKRAACSEIRPWEGLKYGKNGRKPIDKTPVGPYRCYSGSLKCRSGLRHGTERLIFTADSVIMVRSQPVFELPNRFLHAHPIILLDLRLGDESSILVNTFAFRAFI